MARFIINAGNFNVTIQSGIALDDLKKVAEDAPDKLGLYDENGDCYFLVMLSKDNQSRVTTDLVRFSSEADSDGKAVASISIPNGVESVRDYVAKYYRRVLANLNAVESNIPDVIHKIDSEFQAAYDAMEVIGL